MISLFSAVSTREIYPPVSDIYPLLPCQRSSLSICQHYRSRHNDVNQRQRQAHLPSERHQLVITRPGKGRPDQYKEADEQEGLKPEPDPRRKERPAPSAEEHRYREGGDQGNSQILANEEHAELQARVFRMITGN
jgi:hypothetical protein